jgi:DNA-binding NarL/FixJ family response regulator
MSLRILIADDHEMTRRMLRALLETHAEWEICGEAADGEQAVAQAAELKPDVVILDLAMPRMDGLQAARKISSASPMVPILMHTAHASSALALEAQKAGVKQVVSKGESGNRLVSAVEAVLKKKSAVEDKTRMEVNMTNVRGRRDTGASPGATTETLARWNIENDMELAREAQAQLLPRRLPALNTLSFAGICLPARQVGGDFYDFVRMPYQCMGLILGDIAGKGVAAALQMANLKATLRSLCGPLSHDLRELLRSVSEMFSETTSDGSYATLFFGEYNDRNRRLRYANCGHPAPFILRRDASTKRLEPTGCVLGLEEGWDGSVAEVNLEPGDTLVLYSDGVTETTRDGIEEFGEERLANVVRKHDHLPVSDLVRGVVAALKEFGGRLQDDTTVVAARCVW